MQLCSRGQTHGLTAPHGHDRIRLLSLSAFPAHADVAELADAPDLGSGAARRMGSTPFIRTILIIKRAVRCAFTPLVRQPSPVKTREGLLYKE